MLNLRISWVVVVLVLLRLGLGTVAALPPSLSVADAEDLLTAPLHIRELFAEDGLVYRPAFSFTLLGTGALLGGAFALDETLRSHLRQMSRRDADLLQDLSSSTVGAGTGLLYAYGLSRGDPRAREYALTATEGAGVAPLMARGFKAAFGRLRPHGPSCPLVFRCGRGGATRRRDHGTPALAPPTASAAPEPIPHLPGHGASGPSRPTPLSACWPGFRLHLLNGAGLSLG